MEGEKCGRCKDKAAVFLAYGPHYLCREHFLKFFERRFKRTIRNYDLLEKSGHIAVAFSGGKDSAVMLYLLNKIFSKSHKITAITIDEGIPDYSRQSTEIAERNCKEWNIENIVKISDRKTGITLEKILEKTALEIKSDKIATGHTLDDIAENIAASFFENDAEKLSENEPLESASVTIIKPLYETPENEVKKYADFTGIKYCNKRNCRNTNTAKQNSIHSILEKTENKFPGTKYSLISSFIQLKPALTSLKTKQLKKLSKQ